MMPEQPGKEEELNFLSQETDWLKTAVVSHRIREERGRFWIDMIFSDAEQPLRKLIRPINHYSTREKAEWHANILQRQISADPRDPRPKKDNDADHLFSN
jgi:hypothetical protein